MADMPLIHIIVAARPNFIKVAPLMHALKRETFCRVELVHTGQHYDANMSDALFGDFSIPEPDYNLSIGSGTHAEQTGQVMIAYEKICLACRPDRIIVVGDVNSTLACALVGAKLHIPVAHLEAGLRSFDRSMPEEINRIVTDTLADVLWTPSPDADENLRQEGISPKRIVRVGNIMIDALELLRDRIEARQAHLDFGLSPNGYGVVTLHRPSNVDNEGALQGLLASLLKLSKTLPLVFPVHPRTNKMLDAFNLTRMLGDAAIYLCEPLSYIDFMSLICRARLTITDSGGIQEETTYLGIPCLTLRPNTERPITVTQGTNILVAPDDLVEKAQQVLQKQRGSVRVLDLWDGKTADRVVESLRRLLAG